jgi:hypothetical protein
MEREMQKIAETTIKPTHMVSEGSWGARRVGKHASTMTLYADERGYFIEWDIPALETTETIGLSFEHKTLTDYDGIFSLPKEAIAFLRKQGFRVPREFEN